VNVAIILAAGSSKRMRGVNKLFFKIKGKPLIVYTIQAFEKHPQIQKIILVTKKENFKKLTGLIKKYNLDKISQMTEGGKERQESALNGLKAAEKLGVKPRDLILFHDGGRPFVTEWEITKGLQASQKYGAALVGQLSRDTVKTINEKGEVLKTLDRRKIFLAQTPQIIEYSLAKKAFEKALQENFQGTDDVSLVERLGKKVKAVPGDPRNIKITYPEDLIKIIKK